MTRIARVFAVLMVAAGTAVPAAQAQARPRGLTDAPPEFLRALPPAFSPFGGADLPNTVDLSGALPPPGDQGRLNSCVAWTVAYALRSYQTHLRDGAPLVLEPGHLDSSRVFSPAFVYNQVNNGRNAGTYFADALNLVQTLGAAPLRVMPYNDHDFTSQPDSAAFEAAGNYRLSSWRRLDFQDLVEIKSQLNAGYPVMIGAHIDSAFERAGKDFVWRRIGTVKGSHAMVIVGYSDSVHAVRLLNSWGTQWGDGGYTWLDYDLIPTVVHEAYVAKDRYVPARRSAPVVNVAPMPAVVTTPGRRDRSLPAPKVGPAPLPRVVIKPLSPPSPSEFEGASVQVVRTRQSVADPTLGPGLRFDGLLRVPAGAGGNVQVVIQFYLDSAGRKGRFVHATTPRFSVGRVRAATGTSPFALPDTGATNRAWMAFIPYSAFDLSAAAAGPVKLIAEPVLFVDRFGIMAGPTASITCECGR